MICDDWLAYLLSSLFSSSSRVFFARFFFLSRSVYIVGLFFLSLDSLLGAETLSGICDTGDKVDDDRNLKGKIK